MTTRRRNVALTILGIAALVVLIVVGRKLAGHIPAFTERVALLGKWAPWVYIAGYIVASVLFIPGSLLTLASGAIFGVVRGSIYTFFGAGLGEMAAFLVSRYVARSFVARHLAKSTRFAVIDRAIAAEGRKIVLLLRLSPVFPFNVLNYALGLTTVGFVDYLLATVGIIPGTILYVYYGKVAGDLATLADNTSPPRGAGYWVVLVCGLLATVVVTAYIARKARKALAESAAAPAAKTVSVVSQV